MPGENEVLDDFILDMDIETITLDDMEQKESEIVPELDTSAAAEAGETLGMDQMESINLDDIQLSNISLGGGNVESIQAEGGIESSAEKIDIGNITISGPVELSINTAAAPETFKAEAPSAPIQAAPVPEVVSEPPAAIHPEPEIGGEPAISDIDFSSIEIPAGELEEAHAPCCEEKPSEIMIDEAPSAGAEDLSGVQEGQTFEIPDFESPTAVYGTLEADGSSAQEPMPEINLSELQEMENTQEPEIPTPLETEPAFEAEAALENAVEPAQAPLFSSEDDIISIDGSDLDRILYGTGSSKPEAEASEAPESIQGIEVLPEESIEEIQLQNAEEISEELVDISESVPMAEETMVTEETEPDQDIHPTNEAVLYGAETIEGAGEGEVIEFTPGQEDTISIVEQPAMQETPEAVPSASEETSTDFTFDLSVIPDVAQIEEDEPIALSLDELNNIDISEGAVIDYPTPEVAPFDETAEENPLEREIKLGEDKLEQMASESETSPAQTPSAPSAISLDELNAVQSGITTEKKAARDQVIAERMAGLSGESKDELKTVLMYLDTLLEDLPEDKIQQFAKSEYYDLYVKIMDSLGL